MQIAYLTARPDVFRQTLGHVRALMDFVDDVVVVVPRAQADAYASDDLTVLVDEDLLPGVDLGALDHSSRNFRLRAAMVRHEAIADRFIMSDDDTRPLVSMGLDQFVNDDGRQRLFFFYESAQWREQTSPFDQAQLASMLELQQHGVAHPLAFASHMPQLVQTDLAIEAFARVEQASLHHPLCEWAIYGNLGPFLAPDRFAEPEAFQTLAWPQFPGEWPRQVVPDRYTFENFHAELYAENGLFAGLSTEVDLDQLDTTTLEKIVRWHNLERSVTNLDFPADIDNPWIKGSPVRRAYFGAARAAKKLVDYTNLDDRSALAELTERVRQLEARLEALPGTDSADPTS